MGVAPVGRGLWAARHLCCLAGVAAPAWVAEMPIGERQTLAADTYTGLSSVRDSYGPGVLAAGSVVTRLDANRWEVLGVEARHA